MSTYNGFISSLTLNGSTVSQTMGATPSNTVIGTAVPNKYFANGQFAVQATQGVSGSFYVNVIGAVGGATYVIAGRTGINAVGGFPVPQFLYVGASGSITQVGIPRPAFVQWGSGTGSTSAVIGFTATLYFAGTYN